MSGRNLRIFQMWVHAGFLIQKPDTNLFGCFQCILFFATEIPRKCECRDIICHLSQAVTVQFIQFRIGYTIAADIRFTVRLGRVRPEIACLAQVVVFVSAWWRFIFHHNRKIVGVQSLVCLL